MTTWNPRANDLFLEALGLRSAAERREFLDRASAGDAALRAEVEALLEASDRAGSFLESPPASPTRSMAPEPPAEGAGAVIGPYKLLQQIGEGGMGTVFMAEQERPVRRKVALKVIKSGMDSRQVIARFEAERQALALMDHPNIAKVHDAGTTESGRPYFVMELVKGVPITEYCDERRLTPRERLELFLPVCQAVQHAHQKGVIHRDLKPSNVLVALYDDVPVPKVIDFGIAKAAGPRLTEATLFTEFGAIVGTLEYMSPEQAGLNQLDVDTRSDIYSQGVLLYELLTGTTPLVRERLKEAALLELLRRVREDEAQRPSTRLSTTEGLPSIAACRHTEPRKLSGLVRGELDWIVMKALEKDRTRRYETANGLASDVRRYLDDEPVQACSPSALYRLRKFVRRNKGPALAASLLVLTLLAGILGTTAGLIRATIARAEAVGEAGQKERALAAKDTALAAARQSEREAKNQLFTALLNRARAGRFGRQMGQRMDSLAVLEQAARIRPDERLRDEAIAALALPDVQPGPSLRIQPGVTSGRIDFDGAYTSYAQINDQGVISIHSVPEGEEIGCIKTESKLKPSNLWLSPDGQFVAVLDARRAVQLWRVADGRPLLDGEVRPCSVVAFSPDARQLAVVVEDDRVVVHDVASGREISRWRLPAKAHMLAFHPTDCRLAVGFVDRGKVASIYDAADGRLVADLPVGSMTGQTLAWHPDGTRLAVAGSDPRIQIWDVDRRRRVALLEGHGERVIHLSFHPGGGLLASGSWEGVIRLWDPNTGRQLMQLPLNATPRFSSTGRWLGPQWNGNGVGRMQLLEVTPSREYRTIVSSLGAGQGSYHAGDVSPDGRLLALGMGPARDRLWDLASGRELAVLPTGGHCVLFQREGRELLTCGTAELLRWPIQQGPAATHAIRLGRPQKLPLPFDPDWVAPSPDGRAVAVVSEAAGAGLVMDLTTASVRGQPFAHPGAGRVALSPDGRWVAVTGWHSDRVRLWDAKTGAMVHEWVSGSQNTVIFTPDSRALILCRGDELTFWDVGTAKLVRRLRRDVNHFAASVVFSPDGALMALEMTPAVIHLMEVATGRTVAKLEDPHRDQVGWKCFTPDGTKLVVAAPHAKAIHVWDLRAIRQRLKAIGLDWDWPEFHPEDPRAGRAEPATLEVLAGDLAEPVLAREQKARLDLERCRRAAAAKPDDAKACNDLAWVYLTAPEPLRDLKAALPLAEKAVRLSADSAVYRNTLGVAYYRAARYREAIRTLRANLDKQEDWSLPFDLYFLAMSHARLGEIARARDYYDWAVRWRRTQPDLGAGYLEELTVFQAEAEEQLKQESGAKTETREKKSEPD